MSAYEEWGGAQIVRDVSQAHDQALAIAAAAREVALMSHVSESEAANAIVTTVAAFERAEAEGR